MSPNIGSARRPDAAGATGEARARALSARLTTIGDRVARKGRWSR